MMMRKKFKKKKKNYLQVVKDTVKVVYNCLLPLSTWTQRAVRGGGSNACFALITKDQFDISTYVYDRTLHPIRSPRKNQISQYEHTAVAAAWGLKESPMPRRVLHIKTHLAAWPFALDLTAKSKDPALQRIRGKQQTSASTTW
jgi:hypothetical protein